MITAMNEAIYRPDLGQAVFEFVEGPTMGYIGLEVMPICSVMDQAATFPVIPMEVLLKLPDVSRSSRGSYNRGDWAYENGFYQTREKGWEELMDDSEVKMLDRRAPGLADKVATQRAWNHIMRNQEYRAAAKLFNASNFTAHAVGTEWDTSSTCTPVDDVKDGIAAFRLQCGMLPDALVISYANFLELQKSDQIIDQLKYTIPGFDIKNLGSAELARVFGIPRVLIGGAIYDAAKPGLAASIADIWDDEYAALVKISTGDDITQPGVGRTFLWTDDSPQNPVVETYREEQKRSNVYRVRHSVDERLIQSFDDSGNVVSNIAAACVYLMSNIHT